MSAPAALPAQVGLINDTWAGVSFLQKVCRAGRIFLVGLDPEEKGGPDHASLNATNRDGLAAVIDRWQGRRNIYFRPNEPGPGRGGWSKEIDIASVRMVWVDLDPDPVEEVMEGGFQRERERLMTQVMTMKASPCPPTVIIDSGGGLQAFWCLNPPMPVARAERIRVRAVNEALRVLWRGDEVDGLNHLMRVPCTTNLPTPSKRARGRVPAQAEVLFDDGPGYTLDALEQDLGLTGQAGTHEAKIPAQARAKGPEPARVPSAKAKPSVAEVNGMAAEDDRPLLKLGEAESQCLIGNRVRIAQIFDRLPNRPLENAGADRLRAVTVLRAIKAAMGCGGKLRDASAADKAYFDAHVVPWLERWPGPRNPAETEAEWGERIWDSINDSRVGADYIENLCPADVAFEALDDEPEGRETRGAQRGGHAPTPQPLPEDFDGRKIPTRPWVLGRRFMGGAVTATVAAPGVGKSTHALESAIAIATGIDLTGEAVHQNGAVWLINSEEPLDEMHRRVAAILTRYRIPLEAMRSRLFLSAGDASRLIVAVKAGDHVEMTRAVGELIEHIRERRIVHLVVDPLVATHSGVAENSNEEMERVVGAFRTIAQRTGCSVEIVHHTVKTHSGNPSAHAGDANAARGASSLIGAVRFVFTFSRVTPADALKLGVPAEMRHQLVRRDAAKANYAPADIDPRHFLMRSVCLMNGLDAMGQPIPDGDRVGVPEVFLPVPTKAAPVEQRTEQQHKVLDTIIGTMKSERCLLSEVLPAVQTALSVEKSRARALINEVLGKGETVEATVAGTAWELEMRRDGSRSNSPLIIWRQRIV